MPTLLEATIWATRAWVEQRDAELADPATTTRRQAEIKREFRALYEVLTQLLDAARRD